MINMYDIMKNTISKGGYKLDEMQHRIKRLFLLGDITEEQMDELLNMAIDKATVDAERPETLAMIHTLAEMIAAVEARVKALEGGNDSGGNDDSGEEEQPEYPHWKPWDGISTNYQYGAIVWHNGELWISVFDGQNVWEPGAVGTDNLWQKYTEAT